MLEDPAIVLLRRKVEIIPNPALARDAVGVTVVCTDGRTLTARATGAKGGLDHPLSDRDLEDKFFVQAAPVLGRQRAQRIVQTCWDVERLDDVSRLAQLAASGSS